MYWYRRWGSTPSSGTGPSGAKEGSYYLYVEASGSANNPYKAWSGVIHSGVVLHDMSSV